jgi:hypothetical protein
LEVIEIMVADCDHRTLKRWNAGAASPPLA